MSTTDIYPPAHSARGGAHNPSWLLRAEMWLDDRGKWAWIAAMVLGFILFWPVGLGLLAYMIWSKRMFSKSGTTTDGRWSRPGNRDMSRERFHAARAAMRPSGNTAFDSYKSETLRRLEEEQSAFEEFLARLRAAKDKTEFDNFMDDRAQTGARNTDGADQPA